MYEKYFEMMTTEAKIRNRSINTLKTYIYQLSRFFNWINKPVEDLTLEDARSYIIYMRDNGSSASYCNGIQSSIHFFYKYVLHIQWDESIVPRMRIDRHLPKTLPLEQIERLIDTAQTIRNKAIIALIYSSGLRVSELCRLHPEDIYFSTMQVHITASKNHSDHWTILSEKAKDLILQYWYSYPVKRDILFVSERRPHNPLNVSGVESMLAKVGNEIDLEITPHILRHSFATHLIEQGVLREFVQVMMGHNSPNSTAIYVHVSNKAVMGVTSPLDHPAPKKRGRKKKNG